MAITVRCTGRFRSDKSLKNLRSLLNRCSSWFWRVGSSDRFGDYLRTSPAANISVWVQKDPTNRDEYCVFVQGDENGAGVQQGIDASLRDMLSRVDATDIQPIKPQRERC